MIGNFIAYILVGLSFIYTIYYIVLHHLVIKELSKITEMYIKGKQNGIHIEFPSYCDVSFSVDWKTYKAAKAYNQRMKDTYDTIEKL